MAGEQSGANPRVVLRAFRELRQLRRELSAELVPSARVSPTTSAAA
jgi:hypothetical protein